MARARNIKPGFFKNETLSSLTAHTRLLFAGLWTIADRSGRLEDRPKRIKAEIFPYENVNVERMLETLSQHQFILRYASDGNRFISIPAWKKHQNPHVKEAASTIPEPCENSAALVPVTTFSGTSPADSLFSDSLNSDSSKHSTRTGKFQNPNPTPDEPAYWAERFYERHPKKKNLVVFQAVLIEWWAVQVNPRAEIEKIDPVHAELCDTEDWRKERGRFAPKLDEWWCDRGWTTVKAEDDEMAVYEENNRIFEERQKQHRRGGTG